MLQALSTSAPAIHVLSGTSLACSCCAGLSLPLAQVFTQVSLIMLLYGTLCGGLAFLSDVARVMVMQVGGQGGTGASGCQTRSGKGTHTSGVFLARSTFARRGKEQREPLGRQLAFTHRTSSVCACRQGRPHSACCSPALTSGSFFVRKGMHVACRAWQQRCMVSVVAVL